MGEQADSIVGAWLDGLWTECEDDAVVEDFDWHALDNPRVTRALKAKAHKSFDRLWQSRRMTRGQAYKWLAHELGLRYDQAHMAQMDRHEILERVIAVADRKMGTPLAASDFPDDL